MDTLRTPALLRLRVVDKTTIAAGICQFDLRDPDGLELPEFDAGAHIDVSVAPGVVRSYSICNSPDERNRYIIAVLRTVDSRGGSKAMHDDLEKGAIVTVRSPFNNFPLVQKSGPALLFAGGIGITPLLTMAESLHNNAAPFSLHYSARSQGGAAFVDRLLASSFSANVQFHYDDGPPGQLLDIPSVLGAAEDVCHLYVCGPRGFMDAVLGQARALGWTESRLHWESFKAAEAGAAEKKTFFRVQINSSGQILDVPPDRTIVSVLHDEGIEVPTSCCEGLCGTCVTRVLAGLPDHRDNFLNDDERARNDSLTPCCSRSLSPLLVLDL